MAETPITGLRYLRENDVDNAGTMNYNISRLDGLSTLVMESTTLGVEPDTAGVALGSIWSVPYPASGDTWGTIERDSLLLWTPNSEGDPGWQVIPLWTGAFGYDKATETFVTYVGSSWSAPSKNSVINVTLDYDLISQYSGDPAFAKNWLRLLTVDTDTRIVAVHCLARLKGTIMSKIAPFELAMTGRATLTGGTADVKFPYTIPKLASSNDLSSAPSADDIFLEDYSLGPDPKKWGPCQDTVNSTFPWVREDLVSYYSGYHSSFQAGKATEIESAAADDLTFPRGDAFAIGQTEWYRFSTFMWVYLNDDGPRYLQRCSPNPEGPGNGSGGYVLEIVESPETGASGQYVLRFKHSRGSRWQYYWPNSTITIGAALGNGFGAYQSPSDYPTPQTLEDGNFTGAIGEWIHVGVSLQKNRWPVFYINGQRCAHTFAYLGANETAPSNVDMYMKGADFLVGDGRSAGMNVDNLKVWNGYNHISNPDIAEFDYNGGSGSDLVPSGSAPYNILRSDMGSSVLPNLAEQPTPWFLAATTPTTGINEGAILGVGASSNLELLPKLELSGGEVAHVVMNFSDWYTGDNSTNPPRVTVESDVADITLQILYTDG